MLIHQTKYLQNLKTRFNKDKLNLVSTPVDLGTQLHKSDTKANKEELKLYQQQIGSLIYLNTKTRPDITYTVNRYARFMSNLGPKHFKALDRI
jgi:hypothetical protein